MQLSSVNNSPRSPRLSSQQARSTSLQKTEGAASSSEDRFVSTLKLPPMTVPPKIENQKPPLLTYETPPHSFRTTDQLNEVEHGNRTGLHELNMSGGEQFNEKKLDKILRHSKEVVIIDARQEFHGFIKGMPISWHAADNYNWSNVDKPAEVIPAKENKKLEKLKERFSQWGRLIIPSKEDLMNSESSPQAKIFEAERGQAEIENHPIYEYTQPAEQTLPSNFETEEQMVTRKGGQYIRIPVTDHCRPSDDVVDQVIVALRKLREKDEMPHVHFHCHGGMGRTTHLMTMYDMLNNADRLSCEDIINRQVQLRNRKSSDPSAPRKQYKSIYKQEGTDFLKVFYEYARKNPLKDAQAPLWSEWLKMPHVKADGQSQF